MTGNELPHAGNLTMTTHRMTAAATQAGNEIAKHMDQQKVGA